ncbi:selenocysteine synthase [Cedecea neteri]|uniref:Selenocysteine synthase n=1 Tax=Cedecea neteri TaxID=158822 RepID=A0A2X2TJE9_9ENTR|nr:selenocysteine synthase [Cedecea neteri]
MLSIEDFVQVAQRHNLPLIVDAAAEEDLQAWVANGADMVIYSGAKAFNAPTSGFITGRKQWIAACKAQHHGIARAMKIGKENMVGLVYALENYHQGQTIVTAEQLRPTVEAISAIRGLSADIEQDEAGRAIWRVRIRVNAQELGLDAREVEARLRGGDIAIYARRYNPASGAFLASTQERWLKGKWRLSSRDYRRLQTMQQINFYRQRVAINRAGKRYRQRPGNLRGSRRSCGHRCAFRPV